MVNYVLSFCKITGSSKIFTRNFYLPLLKPLTPKDALRTLRITGKWLLGAKIQHYIPVLLNHRRKRSKRVKNYGKKIHNHMEDFTYMTPVLDPDNENQKVLRDILEQKQSKGVFVYTVEDKKYNIVLQGQFEIAIRDGDIIDILVSQKNDKIIVKLKDFKKVPLELQYFDEDDCGVLYSGEGATSPEDEKFHHHGKYTMSLARMFEEKEMQEEKWEEELKKILRKRKKHKWEATKVFKEMMKRMMKKFDWQKFEEDAKKVIDDIDAPASENLIPMEIADLNATKNVNETISKDENLLTQLPTLDDIPDIIKNMGDATLTQIEHSEDNEGESRKISGVKVTLTSGKECFVSGQMVHTEDGDVFVPGQTVENQYGAEYAPGITINIDNKPTLISGLIMGEEQKDPLFLPTESTITANGQLTFATEPEERPPPEPETERQQRRKKLLRIISRIEEESDNGESVDVVQLEEVEINIENSDSSDEISESDENSSASSSVELNNSEMEELDMEALRLKHEQQRLELERLKQILHDDGMDALINSLEDKKALLKQKLEELRKISITAENNFITYVNDSDAMEAAAKITQEKEFINKLAEVLITITRRSATFRDRNSVRLENINMDVNINPTDLDVKFNNCSMKLKILYKTAIATANDVFKNRPKDQVLALNCVTDILADALTTDEKLLKELLTLMNTPFDRNEICNTVFKQLTQNMADTKLATLRCIAAKSLPPQDILSYIEKILDSSNIMNISFTKIVKINPDVIKYLVENLTEKVKNIKTEEDAVECLQIGIVKSIKTIASNNLLKLMEYKESELVEFIEEALSFAKALGLDDVEENLSRPRTTINNLEENSIKMLKRMTIIRQLAERDYSLKTAITRIKKNPECAKSDPRIRQLIRESAVLMSTAEPLKNSRDVPYDLMKSQNLLAIEDFLIQKSILEYPVLVSRGSLQAVIPKEAARGVLAGRVAYVLIDESGVTNFKPMHMLSAVNVNKNREKRIEDYLSGSRGRSHSIATDNNRTLLQAQNNGTETAYGSNRGRAMSSGALFRGYTGPRA